MSYILDALRKSDQLRRRNSAPTLLPGLAAAEEPKRAPLLAFGALALVLLGAGIAIGWLRPWQEASPVPVAAAMKPPEPSRQAEVLPPPAAVPQAPAPALAQAPSAEPAARAAPAPAAESAARPARAASPPAAAEAHSARHAPVAKAVGKPAPAPVQKAAPRGSPAGAVPQVTIVSNMSDLPVTIQQELPAMSISVHAYSAKPAERLVGINGRLLHEGDAVAPGLTLEQISADGMILSYKGYIFRRGVR